MDCATRDNSIRVLGESVVDNNNVFFRDYEAMVIFLLGRLFAVVLAPSVCRLLKPVFPSNLLSNTNRSGKLIYRNCTFEKKMEWMGNCSVYSISNFSIPLQSTEYLPSCLNFTLTSARRVNNSYDENVSESTSLE